MFLHVRACVYVALKLSVNKQYLSSIQQVVMQCIITHWGPISSPFQDAMCKCKDIVVVELCFSAAVKCQRKRVMSPSCFELTHL